MKGGQRGLGIKVDCEYTMPRESQVLRKMSCCGRLPAAALKVDNRDYLQGLARPPMGHVLLEIRTTVSVEVVPELQHLLCGVSPPSGAGCSRRWSLALEVKLLDVRLGDPEKVGDLSQREGA